MPTYIVRNTKTDEEQHVFCSWDELQEMLNNDSTLAQVITAPGIVSGTGHSFNKAGDGWKDVLKKVKRGAAKGHTVKD